VTASRVRVGEREVVKREALKPYLLDPCSGISVCHPEYTLEMGEELTEKSLSRGTSPVFPRKSRGNALKQVALCR